MSARPTPPDVEFSYPPCPICEAELEGDDASLRCEACEAWWGPDGTGGEWFDPESAQCESTTYNRWTKITHRCLRRVGHEDERHHDGHVVGWTDRDAVPTPPGDEAATPAPAGITGDSDATP